MMLFHRSGSWAAALALLALAVVSTGSAQGNGAGTTNGGKARVGKEARAALAAAGRLSRVPRGASVVERQEILDKAQRAFADIARKFARQAPVVGEAAFRRGQVLGRLGRLDDALKAFRLAAEKDQAAFGARAAVEAGHVQRREKLYPDALESYRRAAASGGVHGARARGWIGKTLVKLGRVPDARKEWLALGMDRNVDGYVRIQAFDDLAMSYVREKKIADAKRVIADAEDALATEIASDDKRGQRLRKKLERMRVRKSIAKAEKKIADKASGPRRR